MLYCFDTFSNTCYGGVTSNATQGFPYAAIRPNLMFAISISH